MPEEGKPGDDTKGGAASAAGGTAAESEGPKKLEFTQEEFDRILAERLARAKPKDYDELVALRDQRDADAEAKKTELEREKEARKAAETKAKERSDAADAKLIRAEILIESAAQNAIDGDIVYALLRDSKDVTISDEGDVKGVKEAVSKLLEDKPMLKTGKSSSSGGEFGGNDPKTHAANIAELERKMNDPKLSRDERQAAGREARVLKMAQIG